MIRCSASLIPTLTSGGIRRWPATTNYTVVDGQIVVPPWATQRKGIQPTVAVTAKGAARAVIKAGQTVNFAATVEAPPGTGKIVWAAWDFDGPGTFSVPALLPKSPAQKVKTKVSTSFAAPGTYFPTLKVASQRNADTQTPYARIVNLGRVRVVVE
jgi:hypothetical protein